MLKWNILTLDEAQDIKTPTARRTIEIKTLDRSASIAVTGTPLENSLLDLWSIMDFAYKNYLCTQKEFENQYMDNEISHYDLEKVVKPLILKREVSNVAQQLPERIVIPVYLTMNKTKLAKYYEIRENIKKQFSKAPSLAAITALRQYCCHPHLRDEFIDQNIFDSCSKYIHLINTIEEIYNRKEKVIIFSSYRKMIDMLVYDLGNRFNIWCSKIDGEVEISKRQCLLDEFQSVNNTAVLVLNPKAAGAGLNITAANHVIHYNPEWNPATEDQASARAYRLGQEKPVTIHRFIYVNTVEEVMDKRLARKRGLAKKIVVGNVGADREDLELILNLGVNN